MRISKGPFSAFLVSTMMLLGMAQLSISMAAPKPAHAPNELIVRFKDDLAEDRQKAVIDKHRLKLKKHLKAARKDGKPRHTALVETANSLDETIATLQGEPDVAFAEPNWKYQHHALSNDPYYKSGNLWGLQTEAAGGTFGAKASTVWSNGVTGTRQVYVGVIDEGVQWNHPDLVDNAWTNPFDPADGRDNDGNGYVDDLHGWDFYYGDNSVYDPGQDNHGTHVAGTIGAKGGNNIGVVGVNWQVSLISAKFLGPDGGYASDAILAVEYFADLKARHGLNIVAINNSWGGGGYSQALHDAFIQAAKAGIVVVAAASNEGSDNNTLGQYPANYDTSKGTSTETAAGYNAVISVAAINSSGALALFSNYGSATVHLGAPGQGILSTVPNGYAYMDGTSMAAPHVAGAVALYAGVNPGRTASQIRQALLAGVSATPSLQGKTITGGRLDLPKTLAPSGNFAGSPAPASLKGGRTTSGAFTVTLTGAAGAAYEIQVSPDLKTWTPLQTVTNHAGTVTIQDAISADWPKKFYRALSK